MSNILTLTSFFLNQIKSSKIFLLIIIVSVMFWGFFFPLEANADPLSFGFLVGIYLFILSAVVVIIFNKIAFDSALYPLIVLLEKRETLLTSFYLATIIFVTLVWALFITIGLFQFPLLRSNFTQLVIIAFRCLFLAISSIMLAAHTTCLVVKYQQIRLFLIGIIGLKIILLLFINNSSITAVVLGTFLKPFFWPYETAIRSLLVEDFTFVDWATHCLIFIYSAAMLFFSYRFFNTKDLRFPQIR